MEESLTQGGSTDSGLQTQPTTDSSVVTPTADGNQETISTEQSTEAVSTTPAQTNNDGGAVETDDGLAKFAKGQGIEDISQLSEREQKLLKVAHDNQKFARSNTPEKKLSDVNELVDTPKQGATEDEEFKREFRQYKYERQTDQFWSADGRDRTLEPTMVQILNDKVAELTPVIGADKAKEYAFNLSRDLPTLYNLAQIQTGTFDPQAAKEQGRREERDSIRNKAGAEAPAAHATSPVTSSTKVDKAWIQSTYDPNNAEHRQLLADAMARGDLY